MEKSKLEINNEEKSKKKKSNYLVAFLIILIIALAFILANAIGEESKEEEPVYQATEFEAKVFCKNVFMDFIKFEKDGRIQCGAINDDSDKRHYWFKPIREGVAVLDGLQLEIPVITKGMMDTQGNDLNV